MMSYVARVGLWLLLVAGGGLADGWAATGPSYRLEVAGLACPFCAYGIEKQLYRLEGIAQVETHRRRRRDHHHGGGGASRPADGDAGRRGIESMPAQSSSPPTAPS
jgi:hypothetical protein